MRKDEGPERIRCKECKCFSECICVNCKTVCGFGATNFYENCKPTEKCSHFLDWAMKMTGRKK